MYKVKTILFCICLFFISPFFTSGQQIFDISNVSKEKIIVDSPLVINHNEELKSILLLAIDLSLYNIVNAETTRTPSLNGPYKYHYLTVYSDFTFTVMEKDKFKLVYNPSHPDTITQGELAGYVRIPDIDIHQECADIGAMIKLLEALL